jgi:hypothetical protein
LVEPDDAALTDMPLLKTAASNWLDGLSIRVRHCIVCSAWIVNGHHVGALLLTTPRVAKPTSASTSAVCWDADLPVETLERACADALQEVVPGGRFEPHQDTRR